MGTGHWIPEDSLQTQLGIGIQMQFGAVTKIYFGDWYPNAAGICTQMQFGVVTKMQLGIGIQLQFGAVTQNYFGDWYPN